MKHLFNIEDKIIDDSNLSSFHQWLKLYHYAKGTGFSSISNNIFDGLISFVNLVHRFDIQKLTYTFVFTIRPEWKFKSRIKEKKFKFRLEEIEEHYGTSPVETVENVVSALIKGKFPNHVSKLETTEDEE